MSFFLKNAKKFNKFKLDLIINLISFVFIGFAGIFLNIVILRYSDFNTLGQFNKVFAFFLVVSQFTSLGIHLAIQNKIPQINDLKSRKLYFSSGLLLTSAIALFLISFIYIIYRVNFLSFELYFVILPGIFFFSVNRLILTFFMSKREMIHYAFFNVLRYLLLLILAYIFITQKDLELVTILNYTEVILFIILISFIAKDISVKRETIFHVKEQLFFGLKSFGGNLLLNTSSQIEILILSFYVNDKFIGIYTFPLFIYQGLRQFLNVYRNNITPILSRIYFNKSKKVLNRVFTRYRNFVFKYSILLSLFALLIFPVIVSFSNKIDDEYFYLSYLIFFIMILGFGFSSKYYIFYLIFNQLNLPLIHSVFFLLVLIFNILFNMLLVPFIGVIGASIANLFSNLFSVFLFKLFCKNRLKVEML